MKVVGLMRFGGPEVLETIELPEPHPGPGEVRVRVQAAAVNPSDVAVRASGYNGQMASLPLPHIPGWDAAGVIDEIGPGSDGRLAVGDPVVALAFASSPTKGAYQQQLIVPAASVVRAPRNLDVHAASTLLMNALTARLGLDAMALKPGQTLAVTGSAGALGGFVIQLAKADGLRVIADVSDVATDRELVRQLGADEQVARGPGFNERVRALVPNGVDALFDTALLNGAAVPAIADGGMLVTVRGWNEPVARGIRVFPVLVMKALTDTARLERLRDQAEACVLTPRVFKVLPASRGRRGTPDRRKGRRSRTSRARLHEAVDSRLTGGLEDDVADRGVGGGHVVEAVQLLDVVAERRAHDQPHDQLDAFAAALAQKLEARDRSQIVGLITQPIEKRVVELRIDQPRAWALQLVAHAARAPHLHCQVLRESCAPRRGSPRPIASSGWPKGWGTG